MEDSNQAHQFLGRAWLLVARCRYSGAQRQHAGAGGVLSTTQMCRFLSVTCLQARRSTFFASAWCLHIMHSRGQKGLPTADMGPLFRTRPFVRKAMSCFKSVAASWLISLPFKMRVWYLRVHATCASSWQHFGAVVRTPKNWQLRASKTQKSARNPSERGATLAALGNQTLACNMAMDVRWTVGRPQNTCTDGWVVDDDVTHRATRSCHGTRTHAARHVRTTHAPWPSSSASLAFARSPLCKTSATHRRLRACARGGQPRRASGQRRQARWAAQRMRDAWRAHWDGRARVVPARCRAPDAS